MLNINNVSLHFGGQKLFANVNIKFTPGNCYGVIGANGAGKSTFLRILSGDLEPSTGDVSVAPGVRMSVLKQDQYQFDANEVLETVIMGNPGIFQNIAARNELYGKPDFNDVDGMKAAELECEFAEMNGWEAESDASSLLQGLGIGTDLHKKKMAELQGGEKVKVLLAQALFGNPGILVLDEPTNNLDTKSIRWLENFFADFQGTVIVVSHDRHFLNEVCTHMADVDHGKIKLYVGNYDFWYESSQLALRLMKDENKKKEDQIKHLQDFVARFSANASKSKQATSRKRLIEKITLDDITPSTRRYPFLGFKPDREPGKDILTVQGLTKTIDGRKVLDDISFTVTRGDKIALVGNNEIANSILLKILSGEMEADAGEYKWGITISMAYFPKDNTSIFEGVNVDLVDWLREYSPIKTDNHVRSFLGRVLFSGEDALKPVKVLSGGEKVRLMFAKMMITNPNILLLDHPTNHLDLEAITALNNGLTDYSSNILLTSHDHQLIQTIANRIMEITPKGLLDMRGTYDEYLQKVNS
ncbi:MAG: ATP-binding cassette domain-containing protein [Peptococcaceae bacterium]|nr:ATP-binding cassette domain-containing protein [Peptococcaceae bacterium]